MIITLGLDYVDLYLIHWPFVGRNRAWQVLEKIYASGRVKAIGVSNYRTEHLKELLSMAKVVPAVNQIEFNPFTYRKELLEYCKAKGIAFEAYSPLNRGKGLQEPTLQNIASKYNKTTAQVALRWSLQHGVIVIPKSSHRERIIENVNIFDFEIQDADITRLDSLG